MLLPINKNELALASNNVLFCVDSVVHHWKKESNFFLMICDAPMRSGQCQIHLFFLLLGRMQTTKITMNPQNLFGHLQWNQFDENSLSLLK
jgi:hypothetical protein